MADSGTNGVDTILLPEENYSESVCRHNFNALEQNTVDRNILHTEACSRRARSHTHTH
jgi:hypothetical protein